MQLYFSSMNTTSESLLLRLRHAQDSQAWQRFVQLYTPLIFFWARKNGCGRDDAADLVQDVLSIVFRRLPNWQYDPEKSFRGWLRTITLNRHRELLRRKPLPHAELDTGFSMDQIPLTPEAESWDRDYVTQLLRSALELQQHRFADRTWRALMQWLHTDQAVSEIAREHGTSPWTLYAARKRLLQQLHAELDGLWDD